MIDLKEIFDKPLPIIPNDIISALDNNEITKTRFTDKNEILKNTKIQQEIGIAKLNKNEYLVSMTCPMPGVSIEMVKWWFWWHVQDGIRYKAWFPTSHKGNKYNKKYNEYFLRDTPPNDFFPHIRYPKETFGKLTTTLRMNFVTPTDFGFSNNLMNDNDFSLIICGHVGVKGMFTHTEMAHMYKETNDGLFLISRFWIGTPLKSKLIKKMLITKKMARNTAEHCYIEYHRLAEILPSLYSEYFIKNNAK